MPLPLVHSVSLTGIVAVTSSICRLLEFCLRNSEIAEQEKKGEENTTWLGSYFMSSGMICDDDDMSLHRQCQPRIILLLSELRYSGSRISPAMIQ